MRNFDYREGDGENLAIAIRALAIRARKSLNHPVDPSDSRELLAEIESLERRIEARSYEELSRWLASLRRKVEDHSLATV